MLQKKCDNCNHWTNWKGNASDLCENCHQPLDQRTLIEHAEWRQREQVENELDWFRARETDSPMKAFFRRAAFIVHAIFGAIAWLFIWAFTASPG
jgi:predicted amidophosphoribosyltransferase